MISMLLTCKTRKSGMKTDSRWRWEIWIACENRFSQEIYFHFHSYAQITLRWTDKKKILMCHCFSCRKIETQVILQWQNCAISRESCRQIWRIKTSAQHQKMKALNLSCKLSFPFWHKLITRQSENQFTTKKMWRKKVLKSDKRKK